MVLLTLTRTKFKGIFILMIGFVTLIHLLYIDDDTQKVAKSDKANHGCKMKKELAINHIQIAECSFNYGFFKH